jgi:hypothetical protein
MSGFWTGNKFKIIRGITNKLFTKKKNVLGYFFLYVVKETMNYTSLKQINVNEMWVSQEKGLLHHVVTSVLAFVVADC